MSAPRERWASHMGFILATAGYSIGLGNIWRFPWLAGEHGGGTFLLVYLVLTVAIGLPLFTAELSLGRRTQLTPIAGWTRLTGSSSHPWNLTGWVGVFSAFLVMSYYVVVMGWVLVWAVRILSGGFDGFSPEQVEGAYARFVASPGPVVAATGGVIALTAVVVIRGVRGGVESAARWLMPGLFGLLGLSVVVALTLPGAGQGIRWFLVPEWSRLSPALVMDALSQVFFSIGIGMAAAWVFGSYLHPTESDVPGGALQAVSADTLVSVLAGLALFPALFSFGFAPASGPGLLFVTMTSLFATLPYGSALGGLFFGLVWVAGFTSLVAVLEALVGTAMDSLGLRRGKAVALLGSALFLASLPSALSAGPLADVRLLGYDLFGLADLIGGRILLALGGLGIALYVPLAWGFEAFRAATNQGAEGFRVVPWWRLLVTIVVPVGVVVVLLGALGLVG